MNDDRHRIRTVSLEVDSGPTDAFRLRNEVEAWARDVLLPELEAAFAGLPETRSHIVLDRLDLALEASPSGDWDAEVLPQLRARLGSALTRALRDAEAGTVGESLPPGTDFARKLAFYLEHGVLPWNLAADSAADLHRLADAWLDLETGTEALRELAVTWKIPSARRRMLDAFPVDLVVRILGRLYGLDRETAGEWADDALRLEDALRRAGASRASARDSGRAGSSGSRGLPRSLLEEILAALAHNPETLRHGLADDIVFSWMEGFVPKPGAASGPSPRDKHPTRDEFGPESLFPSFRSEAFRRAAARRSGPIREGGGQGNLGNTPGYPPEAPNLRERPYGIGPSASDQTPEGQVTSRNRTGRSIEDPLAEGIHIPNAGLVLLAPFLAMLFERTGAASGSEMRDPDGAIALTHYLATGEEGPAEFQLPLAKLLCGMALDQAVEIRPALPSAWKDEADSLLRSAIGHWSVLKDTSIQGLREAFLQRPGKLTRRPADWRLQVEQKAYDMLLQQLPWSCQYVKLPWMERVLRTEWAE